MRPDVEWELWSHDYFDGDAGPLADAKGFGLEPGLRLLWRKTLDEGLQDDGRPTFTWFQLRHAGGTVDLPRDPLMNADLGKLRRWRAEPGLVEAVAHAHLAAPTEDGARAILGLAKEALSSASLIAALSAR